MRRVVSVWLPTWPTDRLRRTSDAPQPDRPLIVACREGSRRLIHAADRAALALGLAPGLTVAVAQAMHPDVTVVDADLGADAAGLERLAVWALRYAPLVAADPPDALVLDVAGAAHLHDGEAALLSDLSRRLARNGIASRTALAETWAAARGLARHAADRVIIPTGGVAAAVVNLPVAALGLEPPQVEALSEAGIDTVGELAATPRVSIALRFGSAVTGALDRMYGQVPEFFEPVLAPSIPHARLSFAEPLMHATGLAIALDRLAAALCADLEAAALGARQLDLRFRRVDNDVLMHSEELRILQDVVTCIGAGCTIDDAGFRRERTVGRWLKTPDEMARLFARHPDAVARTLEIVDRCRFSMDQLRYTYPAELDLPGETAQQALDRLTWAGAAERYPKGVPPQVDAQLRAELALIAQLQYAPYFLTVNSIVRFARSRGILCQGRGSAANSAVCFVLGVTSIDPERGDLLFERFVSAERAEPPDIDVDFDAGRREEVIQWVYETYGRDRAALAATVIRYRARSAVREVGKVLGIPEDLTGQLAKMTWAWDDEGVTEERVKELGLSLEDRRLRMCLDLTYQLMHTPRHFGQHPGGFILTLDRLDDLVPIEPASMVDRQIVEWDKDDLDALKCMKVDVLGLGMLGALSRAFNLLGAHKGLELDLAAIPQDDVSVYDMICRADTVGVFQIESRAQMSMLPRLKPRNLDDLTIEVAVVRPGPIQGDMVHPFLRRREGIEPVVYPTPEFEKVLGKTLGVPLFQEQAMSISIHCASFTPGEADQLRRAMATFKYTGGVSHFRDKLIAGMVANGYDPAFAEHTFKQLEGFGSYGFPMSHAASFAILAYASSWMKYHHPDVFLCALLNAQPMGFYAPAQLVG